MYGCSYQECMLVHVVIEMNLYKARSMNIWEHYPISLTYSYPQQRKRKFSVSDCCVVSALVMFWQGLEMRREVV